MFSKLFVFIILLIDLFLLICRQSSNMLNQARLKALKVREDHVRNVLDDARKRLSEVTHNPTRYREVLSLLIIQGLYQVIFCILITLSLCYVYHFLILYILLRLSLFDPVYNCFYNIIYIFTANRGKHYSSCSSSRFTSRRIPY
jgi:hypothetical protein